MRKFILFLVAMSLLAGMVLGVVPTSSVGQNVSVTVGPKIVVSISDADFGTVLPGTNPSVVSTINNMGSNVNVYLDSVTLASNGTIFDSLKINGMAYGSFTTTVDKFSSKDITLDITIPVTQEPIVVGNVVTYTVTGPVPPSS